MSQAFQILQGDQDVPRRVANSGEGRDGDRRSDPLLAGLERDNLRMVLIGGNDALLRRWEFGAAIGRLLTERR